ncbi:GAF and ANTAR domain-containing protein [Kribbella sancticallisti]
MSDQRLIEAARRLAEALTPGHLDHTLARITAAAVEVLPDVDYASITVQHADGRLETFAPTAELLWDLDALQYELREGPCYEAAVDTVHVTSPDLAADPRFPRYGAGALRAGILSQAGIRLYEAPKANGALNLYSTRLGKFDDLGTIGELFKHQSAMAISYAHEIHNLQEAMRTRRTIGQAVGIVMERYKMSDPRAFAFLSRLSQDYNIKLRLVAEEIVASSGDQEKQNDPAGNSR